MIKHFFNTKISNIDDREIREATLKYANAYLNKTDFESEQLVEALSTMLDNFEYAGNNKVHNLIKETVYLNGLRNLNLSYYLSLLTEASQDSGLGMPYHLKIKEFNFMCENLVPNLIIFQKLYEYLVSEQYFKNIIPITKIINEMKDFYNNNHENIHLMNILYMRNQNLIDDYNSQKIYESTIKYILSNKENKVDYLRDMDNIGNSIKAKMLIECVNKFSGDSRMLFNNFNTNVKNYWSFTRKNDNGDMVFVTENIGYKYNEIKNTLTKIEDIQELRQYSDVFHKNQMAASVKTANNTFAINYKNVLIEMKFNNETKQKEVYTNGSLLKEDFSSYLYKVSRAGDAHNTSALYSLYNDMENYKRIEIATLVENAQLNKRAFIFNLCNEEFAIELYDRTQRKSTFADGLNGIQLKNTLLEYLGYDFSDDLQRFMSKEKEIIAGLEIKRQEINEQIDKIDKEIEKIDLHLNIGLINENYSAEVNNLRERLLASRDNYENNLKSINLTIEQIVNQSINEEKIETQLAYPAPDNVSNKRNPVGVKNNEIDRQHYKAMTWAKQNMNDSSPVKPTDGDTNSNFMAGQIVQVKDPSGSGFITGTIISCNSLEKQVRILVNGTNRRILVSFDDIKNSIEKPSVKENLNENELAENPDKESTTNADGEIKKIEKPSNPNDYQIRDEYILKDFGIKVRIIDVDSVNGTLKFVTMDGDNRMVDATFAQADEYLVKESLNEEDSKKLDADQIQEDPDFNEPDKKKKLEKQLDQNTNGMLKPEKQRFKAGDKVEIQELETSAEVLNVNTASNTIQVKLTNGKIVEYPTDSDKIRSLKESLDDKDDNVDKKWRVKRTNNKGMDNLTQMIVDLVKDDPRCLGFDDINAFEK